MDGWMDGLMDGREERRERERRTMIHKSCMETVRPK